MDQTHTTGDLEAHVSNAKRHRRQQRRDTAHTIVPSQTQAQLKAPEGLHLPGNSIGASAKAPFYWQYFEAHSSPNYQAAKHGPNLGKSRRSSKAASVNHVGAAWLGPDGQRHVCKALSRFPTTDPTTTCTWRPIWTPQGSHSLRRPAVLESRARHRMQSVVRCMPHAPAGPKPQIAGLWRSRPGHGGECCVNEGARRNIRGPS